MWKAETGQQEKGTLWWGQKQHRGQKQQMLDLGPYKETKRAVTLLGFGRVEQRSLCRLPSEPAAQQAAPPGRSHSRLYGRTAAAPSCLPSARTCLPPCCTTALAFHPGPHEAAQLLSLRAV